MQNNIEVNNIYKNGNGECFLAIEDRGTIVLSNPSYPFVFLPEVQQPLEIVGSVEEFGHLLQGPDYQFHEGESLRVGISNGNLIIEE